MRKGIVRAVALVLPLFASGLVKAGVAYSNLGPADSFNAQQVWPVSGGTSAEYGMLVTFAMPFTASASGDLSLIKIALEHLSGANSFTVSLRADSGNAPGSTLESFSLTNAFTGPTNNPYPVDVLTSVVHPTLVMGTKYWVEATPSGPASNAYGGWNQNSTGATGTFTYVFGGPPSTLTSTLGAFAVNVTDPVGASAPLPAVLPASLALCSTLLLPRRRRRLE